MARNEIRRMTTAQRESAIRKAHSEVRRLIMDLATVANSYPEHDVTNERRSVITALRHLDNADEWLKQAAL